MNDKIIKLGIIQKILMVVEGIEEGTQILPFVWRGKGVHPDFPYLLRASEGETQILSNSFKY